MSPWPWVFRPGTSPAIWSATWVPVDPTNLATVAERHIAVARGRDYADVRPLSGVYHGPPPDHDVPRVHVMRRRAVAGDDTRAWLAADQHPAGCHDLTPPSGREKPIYRARNRQSTGPTCALHSVTTQTKTKVEGRS